MSVPFILLASASPRRHEILTQLDIPHGVLHVPPPPGEDEPILPNEAPDDYVQRTALNKAHQATQWLESGGQPDNIPAHWPKNWRQAPVLCADTTVILDDTILGKPGSPAEAARMLTQLSGREHRVHTAIVLSFQGRIRTASQISEVQFQVLNPAEIEAYCATGEPMGKAGAYAIQGRAAGFVCHLSGSHSGVMGLPAHETLQLLKGLRTSAS
ncbi:Maf family protein [Castellaniella sp.]|uniref:Maf family protein n=1 Tax=Castellaniella sp. TaxID=1955812 RepID=UPI003A8E2541